MLNKILIANRGDIACRIADTCERLGLKVATVHSEADRNALHVRRIGESVHIGAAPSTDSYLNIKAIVAAAHAVNADAVHPGIGFLSESPEFAEAVEAAGLTFIGPRPDTMRRFSDKASAKREAVQAGIPVIEGGTEALDAADAVAERVRGSTLPVLLKAVAGGGGRGVRVIEEANDGLDEVIASAMREAQASFGRPDLLVEQFIDRPRHIEVQIAGDGNGDVIHLYERECSLQRRFQKVIEEAPADSLSPELREDILDAAVRLAQSVNYRGLGTMEFLVAEHGFWFLECNPRLQVEHTVTEEITGLDLVEVQLRIAESETIGLTQEDVSVNGFAVQARIYAEDPQDGFIPSTGQIKLLRLPTENYRVDTGVVSGSEVTPHYDAMLAKLVAHGRDRVEGLKRLRMGLEQSVLLGVRNNLKFLCNLLSDPRVQANDIDNRFIDRELAELQREDMPTDGIVAAAAALWLQRWHAGDARDPWSGYGAWRLDDGEGAAPEAPDFMLTIGDQEWSIALAPSDGKTFRIAVNGALQTIQLCSGVLEGQYSVSLSGHEQPVDAFVESDVVHMQWRQTSLKFEVVPFLPSDSEEQAADGLLVSPLMGMITKVNVSVGDAVQANQTLIVMESMKMEITIKAPHDGVVTSVNCVPGDMVERRVLLAEIE